MRVFHWLLLLFFSVPLAEIYVLLEVGGLIGALPTVALVVFTAVAGATLIRAQGLSTIARVQASLARGEIPAVALVEAAFLLVAGALMLTPGFITDTLGFACLVPPLRRALIGHVLRQRLAAAGSGDASASRPAGARVIEGEFRREDE